MLTKDQLAKIAQRNHIGLGVQERDYIQHLFLSLLYGKTQDFVFKGGTALRVAYNFARYSEDLDFNSLLPSEKVKELIMSTVNELGSFGVKAEFRKPHVFKENGERGLNGDISYQGPLFTGKSGSRGKVRVDVSLRGETGVTKKVVIAPKYDDISQFILTVFTINEIFAEKARALIIRGKPRDLYDVWVLLGSGVEINLPLINKKLMLYNKTFDFAEFKNKVKESERDWETDLRGLLPQTILFKDIQNTVIAGFGKNTRL
ncbi:nucleotidyl transferase AbiEii/AbiGii toxin family protein [Candidatus Gottesmanbacteria bacterium]|nr:nucleotidyl transferase AbiEii/AbiGii toxin family protein [Candidatus Gottesmanbacteria bacterium]MBI5452553.1 nucleotidyl transferase AbiEii/AbiGii toxin family protein [Candidatus Gottesmanbacteria bacterium]